MFNQPADGSAFFSPKNALGHLVLITMVHAIVNREDNYNGVRKMIDEATVDVVDLDSPDQELQERVKMTHLGIVNRLLVGRGNVLGRIGQVPTTKGNPAYVLQGFDETTDAPKAQAWVDAFQRGQFSQPAATVPTPAPLPTPAPVPAPAPVPTPAPMPAIPAQTPPAVDPAVLAALMAQLGATPVAQQ